jgi:hypothetical protein
VSVIACLPSSRADPGGCIFIRAAAPFSTREAPKVQSPPATKPWSGDVTDSSAALAAAGQFILAHLILDGTRISVRLGLTVNASGEPSAMDVWDARVESENPRLLEAFGSSTRESSA